jgi:hypothetical protein
MENKNGCLKMILWKLNLKNEKIGLYEMKRDGDIRNI